MPDSTNNHGGSWDLTIPAGDDTVDIVRDVGTLGVEVDVALSEAFVGGFNADAGDGDYSGATAPLSLYGTSRPDTENIQAPVGSSYTCTDSDGDGNFGAREWRYTGGGWVCVEGRIESTITQSILTAAGISAVGGVSYIAGSILRDATSCTLNLEIGLTSGSSSQTHFANLSPTNDWYAYVVALPEIERVSGSVWFAEGNNKILGSSPVRVNRTNNQLFTFGLHSVATPYVTAYMKLVLPPSKRWPTEASLFTIDELKAEIEQAAKDNPELAEQLKAELEALQAGE